MNKICGQVVLPSLVLLSLLLVPGAAMAQPPVAAFVSNLDVRCYDIPHQVPINLPLRLDHLNPLFIEKGFPAEHVTVREPQQLCVPVAKDNVMPPANVLPWIRYVDWKCYGIDGPPLDYQLRLDHLNPVIREKLGPSLEVFVREPQQLCVPVMKNNAAPPAAVRQLIQWLDVKCYRVETHAPGNAPITLTHLNPLLVTPAPEPAEIVGPPTQLCVPVAKNQTYPPDFYRQHIAYSDVLCYPLRGQPLNRQLQLRHLNPVLIQLGLPVENVFVTESEELCVPVAKDGRFPPTGPVITPAG